MPSKPDILEVDSYRKRLKQFKIMYFIITTYLFIQGNVCSNFLSLFPIEFLMMPSSEKKGVKQKGILHRSPKLLSQRSKRWNSRSEGLVWLV